MFKSIKTGVLAAILISSAVIAQAQKKLSEGSLVYGMEYKIDAPGAPAETKVKFNGDVSKMDIEAGPASIGIFMDLKSGTGLVLVDVPVAQMQKAAKLTKTDVDEMNAAKPKLSDFKATGEKAVIIGYNAEKYTFKNDKDENGELWVTTELELPLNIVTAEFKEVKGTVLKYADSKATVTLKSVNDAKVGALSVTVVPSGYDEITYAELKAMQGGGGE
ncbi:MAG: hypothetical protein V4541_10770 [Bacteroidota bacterium]